MIGRSACQPKRWASFGLCAWERGDRPSAVDWFKLSFVDGESVRYAGYDLRLVGRLVAAGKLEGLCRDYLRKAVAVRPSDRQAHVLLARLAGKAEK